ncbi:MAG: helix-turn-helix domain-containing protein [Acholeplasmatales bacterium]|jgi:DNA-binding PucR family transcriptional regulator|nr:helix-turn-helix domain-containing protein [Acholeplasmatales bacterium]
MYSYLLICFDKNLNELIINDSINMIEGFLDVRLSKKIDNLYFLSFFITENYSEIVEFINSLTQDLLIRSSFFISKKKKDSLFSESNASFVIDNFPSILNFQKIIYDENDLIENYSKFDSFNLKNYIFGKFVTDRDMKHSIYAFLKNSLNSSKTASLIYMHRNTLDMRISKFERETGYNLRDFVDCFYIFSLIKDEFK